MVWSSMEYINLYFLRPLLASLFVFSLIVFSWFVAWKSVLVHVPLVQEIFGLRKKPCLPKPASRRRLSRFYTGNDPTGKNRLEGEQNPQESLQ